MSLMLDKTHFSLLIVIISAEKSPVIISPDFFRRTGLFLRLAAGSGTDDDRNGGKNKDGETGLRLEIDHILPPLLKLGGQ
jgi:hypothetical protein